VDLKDLILVLKVCAGKDVSNIYLSDDKRIGVSDALHMIRILHQ